MTSYYEVTEANSRRNLLVSSDQRRQSLVSASLPAQWKAGQHSHRRNRFCPGEAVGFVGQTQCAGTAEYDRRSTEGVAGGFSDGEKLNFGLRRAG